MVAGELIVKIGCDTRDFDSNIAKANASTSSFGDTFKALLTSNVVTKVFDLAVQGAQNAARAFVGFIKDVVNLYGEYEQLQGGAQLMFGEGYEYIAEKAKNAYSTVQMSQNDYLKQVNGFAVGLRESLGGNEKAAAELADRIITAEADIIAATGNTQENVQNAFNGIMKSNYTMLDNLGLGIKPTKEGFQEVIDKVNEWNEANGKATEYQIDNLADCQNALVDYIEMQGMAGYAAEEASGTIQGSLAQVKAAWENLKIGIGDPDADIETLVDNLVSSLEKAMENIIPVIERAFEGLGEIVEALVPILDEKIPELIEMLTPLIRTVVQSLADIIIPLLTELAPDIADGVVQLFEAVWAELGDSFPVPTAIFEGIALAIVGPIKITVEYFRGLVSVFRAIIKGIITAFNSLKQKIVQVWNTIKQTVQSAVEKVKTTISNVFSKIKEIMTKPFQTAYDVIKGIVDKLKSIFDFNWSLPKLKLPHFNVTGKFSLNPPSVPHFGISWYKKAYDTPYLFNSPTVIPAMGFGDGNGSEIVYGKDALLRDIREATDVSKTVNITNYITVDGAKDPELYVNKFVSDLELRLRTV